MKYLPLIVVLFLVGCESQTPIEFSAQPSVWVFDIDPAPLVKPAEPIIEQPQQPIVETPKPEPPPGLIVTPIENKPPEKKLPAADCPPGSS